MRYKKSDNPFVVVANMLDFDFVVSEFKRQLHSYIHFWTNTLEKYITPYLIPQLWSYRAIGLMNKVFANEPGFNPRPNHTKDSKHSTWYDEWFLVYKG